jgi:hypothetical protein
MSPETANAVKIVDDDIVALVALELHANNLLPTPDDQFGLWSKYMSAEHLYSDHWLLAYEALEQGWLPSRDGNDYVAADEYFQLLKKHSVKFYDTSADVEEPDSGYNDDDENEDLDLDEKEEETSVVGEMSPEEIQRLLEQVQPPPSDG